MLSTLLVCHPSRRTVTCCLCGAEWEEYYLSVALLDEGESLGTLCPRCLRRSPRETADRLAALSQELDALFRGRTGEENPLDQVARLLRECHRLRALSRDIRRTHFELRERLRVECSRLQMSPRDLWTAALPQPSAILELSQKLRASNAWSLTVEKVIAAERKHLECVFPGLDELSLSRVVDDRYREFLAA